MVRNYLIVTASYWGFTLVDGALRMLVLFHFFRLGYTPFTLAFLFLLYEAAGIGANLAGGYFAFDPSSSLATWPCGWRRGVRFSARAIRCWPCCARRAVR